MLITMGGASLANPGGAVASSRSSYSTTAVLRSAPTLAPAPGVDLRAPEPAPAPRKPLVLSSGSSSVNQSSARGALAAGGPCGPAPPGHADANGRIVVVSKDPAVIAWRECQARQLGSSSYAPAAPSSYSPPSAPPVVSNAPPTSSDPYPPGGASYPASGGGYSYDAGSSYDGPASAPDASAPASALTKGAAAPTDAGGSSATSTGLLVGIGVAALAAGVGIYLAVR